MSRDGIRIAAAEEVQVEDVPRLVLGAPGQGFDLLVERRCGDVVGQDEGDGDVARGDRAVDRFGSDQRGHGGELVGSGDAAAELARDGHRPGEAGCGSARPPALRRVRLPLAPGLRQGDPMHCEQLRHQRCQEGLGDLREIEPSHRIREQPIAICVNYLHSLCRCDQARSRRRRQPRPGLDPPPGSDPSGQRRTVIVSQMAVLPRRPSARASAHARARHSTVIVSIRL